MKKRIVLVVDDEPQVGRIALMAVELAGFATLFAAGGPRALEIAAEYEGRIDALLTAYQMSGMSGCELAREIERRYHNREWAAKMFAIGLMPSSTGKPGGAVTGDRVSHYIIEGGPFSRACREFLETHQLVWESAASGKELGERKSTREKFTCPNCHQNAWAKPGARLLCGFRYLEAHELIPLVPCGLEVEG